MAPYASRKSFSRPGLRWIWKTTRPFMDVPPQETFAAFTAGATPARSQRDRDDILWVRPEFPGAERPIAAQEASRALGAPVSRRARRTDRRQGRARSGQEELPVARDHGAGPVVLPGDHADVCDAAPELEDIGARSRRRGACRAQVIDAERDRLRH